MKIVYIYSLGYSGSTALSLVLGLHPKMVAVGEVFPWLESPSFSDNRCSCGESLDSCSLWGGFNDQINGEMSLKEKYSLFLKHFSGKNNKEKIMVDSSKVPRKGDYLNIIKEIPGVDLRVIFLMRDVRGFSLSNKKHKNNKGSILLYQLNWWRRNKQFKKYLQNSGFNYLQVGYEELCFKKEETLKTLTNFIGVEFSKKMIGDLNLSDAHIIRGNSMRSDKKRKKEINYDYRWFSNRSVNVNYTLLPLVAKWNEENIYKNIKQGE